MEASMHDIRPPAVAGTFYPSQQKALQSGIGAMLEAIPAAGLGSCPKALVVPHAGYIYSGQTAAAAYARLTPWCDAIRRVVLLGPAHRVPVRGLALPGAAAFATPLGEVALDPDAIAAISDLPQVVLSPAAHAAEHSLEVQLPFLQSVLRDFKLVPLVVGDATPAEVAEVLDTLWGGAETLIVISTDLSHFLPYEKARSVDRETTRQVLHLDGSLTHAQACGGTPLNGLLLAARRHGLRPHLLDQCNSGDTAGDRLRVVGYASFAFIEEDGDVREPVERGAILLPIARAAISAALGRPQSAPEDAPWLREPGACFVTLTQGARLRGCIGSLQAYRPLLDDVKSNACAAAFRDHRFAPLAPTELEATEIEVSLLSPAEPIGAYDEADALLQLRPGIDGVILEYGGHRGTFLPQVWESLPDPAEFLSHLKMKAGLPPDFWADDVKLSRYTVQHWSESEFRSRAAADSPKEH
jgi:AmmeMemoRadiSam system protein B/AmmeMemoRadiSam system protein A